MLNYTLPLLVIAAAVFGSYYLRRFIERKFGRSRYKPDALYATALAVGVFVTSYFFKPLQWSSLWLAAVAICVVLALTLVVQAVFGARDEA